MTRAIPTFGTVGTNQPTVPHTAVFTTLYRMSPNVLYKKLTKFGKTLVHSKPLMFSARQGYVRPSQGKDWFLTTTTVWNCDEMIRRRVRDWRRLTEETGHDGARNETFRVDHDSVYTGTHSVFPSPLMEWIILRYGGQPGSSILDAFAGGPPRGVVSSIMGHKYTGFEIRQDQIDENEEVLKKMDLKGARYLLKDGRFLDIDEQFDCAITCPPYFNLEVYSEQPDDISAFGTYAEFNASMWLCAHAHRERMKPDGFVCIVVGPFRDKKTGELVDFRSHTVENFRDAGFLFWQEIILSKNFASAAKRSTNSWKGLKLVPRHEFLLIFRAPPK